MPSALKGIHGVTEEVVHLRGMPSKTNNTGLTARTTLLDGTAWLRAKV